MPVIQIVLLLVVFGGLALFAIQNSSPALPLVFLGIRTQALPVSLWILLAIACGFFISLLLQFFSYWQRRSLEARIRKLEAEPPPKTPPPPPRQTTYTAPKPEPSKSDDSDWDFEQSTSEEEEEDDWDIEEPPQPSSQPEPVVRERTTYEVVQEPKSAQKAGSVYSYSYREPSDSAVGRSEAVYDVDYRVIVPPYQERTVSEDEEDWGFEEDEEDDDNEDF